MSDSKIILIVENYNAYSHTFIREDHKKIGAEDCILIDILDFGLKKNKFNWRIFLFAIKIILLLLSKDVFGVSKFIFSSSKSSSFVHGVYIFAAILLKNDVFNKNFKLRSHFLGKASFIAYMANILFGCKYSVVCHGSDLYNSRGSVAPILACADEIECVTVFGKGFIFGMIGNAASKKVKIKRNNVMNREYINKSFLSCNFEVRHEFNIIIVARLVPQKNIAFALNVVGELKNKLSCGVRLEIVGDGPLLFELSEMAGDLGIQDNVDFVGVKSQEYIVSRMLSSDCLILPCLEGDLGTADGLPVVFQEALLCGLPVYCSQAFGVFEFIVNNINGYVFDVDSSPFVWAEKIIANKDIYDRNKIVELAAHQF